MPANKIPYMVPTLCNTLEEHWSFVEELKTFLQSSEDYPTFDFLERQWELLELQHNDTHPRDYSNYLSPEATTENFSSIDGATPISEIISRINSGLYPPPELLLWLINCFQIYFLSNGELTLDEVFFGKPQRGKAPYPKRAMAKSLKEKQFTRFNSFIKKLKQEKKYKNLEESATAYFDAERSIREQLGIPQPELELETVDIDSFLRGYRRYQSLSSGQK